MNGNSGDDRWMGLGVARRRSRLAEPVDEDDDVVLARYLGAMASETGDKVAAAAVVETGFTDEAIPTTDSRKEKRLAQVLFFKVSSNPKNIPIKSV